MSDLKKLGEKQIPLKCEICDKEFKNKNGLRVHFKNAHNFLREHQCNVCQKVFQMRSQLSLHLKIVHDFVTEHHCNICQKVFQFNSILNSHMKIFLTNITFMLFP